MNSVSQLNIKLSGKEDVSFNENECDITLTPLVGAAENFDFVLNLFEAVSNIIFTVGVQTEGSTLVLGF